MAFYAVTDGAAMTTPRSSTDIAASFQFRDSVVQILPSLPRVTGADGDELIHVSPDPAADRAALADRVRALTGEGAQRRHTAIVDGVDVPVVFIDPDPEHGNAAAAKLEGIDVMVSSDHDNLGFFVPALEELGVAVA